MQLSTHKWKNKWMGNLMEGMIPWFFRKGQSHGGDDTLVLPFLENLGCYFSLGPSMKNYPPRPGPLTVTALTVKDTAMYNPRLL